MAADGTCSGYCDAGLLNMETGAWITPISWNAAPESGVDITITYREKSFSYSGNVATDFSPVNPKTGTPYFRLPAAGFGGTFTSGDTIQFTTFPAAIPVWLWEHAPAGTAPESVNFFIIRLYLE